jgi:hypothetical protein
LVAGAAGVDTLGNFGALLDNTGFELNATGNAFDYCRYINGCV